MQFHLSWMRVLKSETQLKIIQFLLNHEASMSEREIASVLETSHMSVNRTMRELAQINFVHYSTIGKAHLWKVNRRSFAYKPFVRFFISLKNIPDPLSELKQIVLESLPSSLIKRLVLFGSISKNEEKPHSDIDLFIMVKNTKDQKKLEKPIEKLSNECLDVFGNRLAPYLLTEKEYNEKQHLNIMSEINQGIQLYPIIDN
jgi:predicted nucleotidyltransferase